MRRPSQFFPEDYLGKKIALQIIGGLGDSLVVAGASNTCPITLVCRDAFVPLLSELENVTAISPSQFKAIQFDFDAVCNLMGTFTAVRSLRDECYYKLVSERLRIPVTPPKFRFPAKPEGNSAFLHATASDRNRHWEEDYWVKVAYSLRDAGYDVNWLGVDHDFGFEDIGIHKLSNESQDLLWQARKLSAARLFVGIDSGFLHLAGTLSIAGIGLFFNSRSSNVLGLYANLEGIDEFGHGGPTGTIGIPCEISRKNSKALTPEKVLSKLGVPLSQNVPPEIRKNKLEIGIINYSDEIASYLEGYDCFPSEKPITLYPGKDGSILIKTPTQENVFRAPLIHLKRAIRELALGGNCVAIGNSE